MKRSLKVLFAILAFVVVAVVWLVPFWWMIVTSLKTPQEILRFPPTLLPLKITLKSYLTIFSRVPLASFFLNSILTAVSVTAASVFTSTLGGYIFAKFSFKGKEAIFLSMLSTIMIPLTVLVIPLYLMTIAAGLKNTLIALIIPGLVNALGIFFMRNYLYSIPDSYLEAARIDGGGEFMIFLKVIIPLCKPALTAIAIFVFMENWDSFFWPLIVIDQVSKRTLPLGLGLFTQSFGVQDWNLIMAATLVSMLPFLTFFLIFQRHFIKGITMTGLKG